MPVACSESAACLEELAMLHGLRFVLSPQLSTTMPARRFGCASSTQKPAISHPAGRSDRGG